MSDELKAFQVGAPGQSGYRTERRPPVINCFTMIVLLALIATSGALVFFFMTQQSAKDMFRSVTGHIPDNNLNNLFSEQLKVQSTNGNTLEVAIATSTENFSRESVYSMFGKKVWLSDTKAAVSVPATYRYHVRLDESWQLHTSDRTCVVQAPAIRPSLPVAYDTGSMVKTVQGSILRDANANMALLETSITEKLGQRAESSESIDAVRDASRMAVAQFVKNFLLGTEHWRDGRFTAIQVYFPDEDPKMAETRPPVLQLDAPQPQQIVP